MANILTASGSQLVVIGTEHTLATSTVNGVFIYEIDLTTMVLADTVELRIKGITLSGGAAGQMWKATYFGPQTNVRVQSMAVASDISINITLKQTTGAVHTYPWKLLSQ